MRTLRFSLVRLLPDATTSPSRTTTHPTGTSHRASAPSASSSATRMKRSSSSENSEARDVSAIAREGLANGENQRSVRDEGCRPRSSLVTESHSDEAGERGVARARGGDAMSAPHPRRAPNMVESLTPERAIELAGAGAFQVRLTTLLMLANAGDAVEVLSVALILPTAGAEFGLSASQKGVLTSAVFAGALLGSVAWGLAGDRIGRRRMLATALAVNALFALASGTARTFWFLVTCRVLAGVGVSGCNTAAFTALPEFLPCHARGKHTVALASGWMVGSVYSASTGWALIPTQGWRTFVFVSAAPALACLLGVVVWMPESPRFLAVRGRGEEATEVIRRIARGNARDARVPRDARVEATVPTSPPDGGAPQRRRKGGPAWAWIAPLRSLCAPPLRSRAASIGFVWFSLSWGWYGVMLWLPEYFARLAASGESSNEPPSTNVYAENFAVAWANLPGNIASAFLVDVVGRRATLTWCMASAAAAASVFALAVSWSTGGASGGGVSRAAAGRLYVASACAFNALSVGGWNALDLFTSEAFPTEVRSTAMGALGACGRLGSAIGTGVAGAAVESGLMMPLALCGGAMLAGAGVTGCMTLETKGRELEDRATAGGGREGFFELVDEEELITG